MDHLDDKAATATGPLATSDVTTPLEPFQPPDPPADVPGPAIDVLPRLRRLVEAASARVRAVEQENARLDERITDLSRQNANLLAERQALLSQVAGLQDEITGLEGQRDQLAVQVAQLEQQVAALHEDHVRLANQTADQEARLHNLQLARGQEQSALLSLAEDLERLAQPPVSTPEIPRDIPAEAGRAVSEVAPTEPATLAAPVQPETQAQPAPVAPASEAETAGRDITQMAPPATDELGRAAVNEAFPSSYTVIAYPFARFSDLGQFQAAVQGLPDVQNVRVRRFAQGTLEMRVEYEGQTPLASALRELPLDLEEIHEDEPFQLRVRLRS